MSSHYIEPYGPDVYFSQAALVRAGQLAKDDPGSLTDHDLRMTATYSQGAAQAASIAREKAYLRQFDEPTPAPAPVAPVASGPPVATLTDADDFSTPTGLEHWARKHAAAAVPVVLWERMVAAARTKREALESRVALLEARLAALEATAAKGVNHVRWSDTYISGAKYREGELVTGKGGVWICTVGTTTAAPGSNPTDWRLVLRAKSKDAE